MVFFGAERSHADATSETQAPERGHRTLQPLYSRGDQPARFSGGRKTICDRRFGRDGDRRGVDAELCPGAAGLQDRRPDQGRIHDRSVATGERKHQGIPRPARERRHADWQGGKTAWRYRRAREPGLESPYRGHRAPDGTGGVHGIRARRPHVAWWVSWR